MWKGEKIHGLGSKLSSFHPQHEEGWFTNGHFHSEQDAEGEVHKASMVVTDAMHKAAKAHLQAVELRIRFAPPGFSAERVVSAKVRQNSNFLKRVEALLSVRQKRVEHMRRTLANQGKNANGQSGGKPTIPEDPVDSMPKDDEPKDDKPIVAGNRAQDDEGGAVEV